MSRALCMAIILGVMCAFAAPANAQEGARISGFYSGAIGEGETNVSAGGSVGYRFTPRFGFDFEALALPDFETDDRDGGRGVAFLSNFVTEFPSPAAWLTPYVQGGGGVANISSLEAAIPTSRTSVRGRATGSRRAVHSDDKRVGRREALAMLGALPLARS